jgi:hypothetical protein
MTENDQAESWSGRDLYDMNGDKIGTVAQVRHGDAVGNLTWVVVDPGVPAKRLLIPANDVRSSADRLSVPYTKDRVESAPPVEAHDVLTDGEQVSLCRYYGLVHPGEVTQGAEGCEEMPDVRPAG